MSALDVSAYDPIFWLHHCNVDRLWAIWGALNPNSYVEPGAVGSDSFTAKTGTIEDVNTQLKPFWDGSGTKFWNSTGVKETITFNYAYPETQKWKFANVADYQRSVKSTVAQLYGTGNVVRDFIASGAIKSLPTTSLFTTQKAVVHGGASTQRTVRAAAPVGEAQAPMIQVDNDIGPDSECPSIFPPSKHEVSKIMKDFPSFSTNSNPRPLPTDQKLTTRTQPPRSPPP